MDVLHPIGDLEFVWDFYKAASNIEKHGVRFEQACEVFFDPWCGWWTPAWPMRHEKLSSAEPKRAVCYLLFI